MSENTVILGSCPLCGDAIVETKRNYGCSGWKNGCKFTLWKEDKFLTAIGVKLDNTFVETLLRDGSVFRDDLISKKGTIYSAYLTRVKDPDSEYMNWKMEFPEK